MRVSTKYQQVNANTPIYLTGFGATRIVVMLTKLDSGSSGAIQVSNMQLQPYTITRNILLMASPARMYEFPAADIGQTTTHESVSGVGFSVAANALQAVTGKVQRYAGAYGMTNPAVSVSDPNFASTLRVQENLGQSWTVEASIFMSGVVAFSGVILDVDAGVTNFIHVGFDSANHPQIFRSGGGGVTWTSAQVASAAAWHHVVWEYNAGTLQSQSFIDGVAGTATASTRGGYSGGGPGIINDGTLNNIFVSQLAVYKRLLTTDEITMHNAMFNFDENFGSNRATAASIPIGGSCIVLFTNDATPLTDASLTASLVAPLTPWQRLIASGGTWDAVVTTYFES